MKKEIKSYEFFVEGMHCAACELVIEKKLGKVDGVSKVDAKLHKGKVYVNSSEKITSAELSKLVQEDGYKIIDENAMKKSVNLKELALAFAIAIGFMSLFILVQKLGIVNLVSSDTISYPFIFMIGVIASLSTCMAVVGGLVLSISSNYAKEGNKIKPLVTFHISRLVGFFVLGGVIGLLGSAFILTTVSTFIINLVLFVVMVIMGINLLDVLSITKSAQLKMPKFFGRNVLKLEQSNSKWVPIALGVATFVLPCGFTQSIQLYSLTTGSFVEGAITMLVFALGTFPVLALISFASVKLSKTLQSGIFFKSSGFIVIFFAIFNFIAALAAIGLIPPVLNI